MAQYSVWLQEDYVSSELHSGLLKEGYVMTKISIESLWSPTYVCLKLVFMPNDVLSAHLVDIKLYVLIRFFIFRTGVLYLFEKNPQRAPKFTIPLQSNVYKGCRILNDSQRPHSFEILLDGNITVNFGTADETEMMEWIRLLYVSASPVSLIVRDMFEYIPY